MEFLPPHHWMDATKAAYARIQHRAIRHHEQGVEIMVRRIGGIIAGVDTREMLHRHLFEDTSLGRLPQAADWLEDMLIPEWLPINIPCAEHMSSVSSVRWGGKPEDWLALHSWFLDPMGCEYYGDARWLLMRHHAWGAFDCEEEFGPLFNGIPTRVVAEAHIRAVMGSIPPVSDWLSCIPLRGWMSPSPTTMSMTKQLIKSQKLLG